MAVFSDNMLPLHIIESKSFQDFVSSCIAGKKSMSRRIEDEYDAKKKAFEVALSNFILWLLQLIYGLVKTGLILL